MTANQLLTAAQLTAAVIETLTLHGYTVWRNNAGRSQNNVRLSPSGTPDVIGYDREGRFVGVEIKAGRDKPRESQIEWMAKAQQAGCRVCVVRSIRDVESQVVGGELKP